MSCNLQDQVLARVLVDPVHVNIGVADHPLSSSSFGPRSKSTVPVFCAVKYFRYRSNNFPYVSCGYIDGDLQDIFIYTTQIARVAYLLNEQTLLHARILSTKTDFLIMYTTSRVCFFIIVFYCAATHVSVFFSFNFVVAKV